MIILTREILKDFKLIENEVTEQFGRVRTRIQVYHKAEKFSFKRTWEDERSRDVCVEGVGLGSWWDAENHGILLVSGCACMCPCSSLIQDS